MFASGAMISASADPATVSIGDVINYSIAVEYPKSVKIGLLGKADSMLGDFRVLAISLDSLESRGGTLHQELHFKLTYFGLTDNVIPPFGMVVVNPDTTVDTVLTQPIRISFLSALGAEPIESLDIRDIKPPKGIPFNYKKLALDFAIGILLVAMILGYLWYRYRRNKGLGFFEFIAPAKPPWERALLKLDTLAESDLLKKGEFKEYFDQLTDIHREYIEGRFKVMSLELSTTETMENLRDAKLDLEAILAASFIDNTETLLRRADLVKFAKFVPDAQIALIDWELVRKLVIETTPKPKPPDEQASRLT